MRNDLESLHLTCHLSVLSVASDPGGTQHLFEGRMVLASDDVVFAWAIGKASLILLVSFGSLVYAAWTVTYQKENTTRIGIPKDSTLKYKSWVKAPIPAHHKRNNWTPASRSSPLRRRRVYREARETVVVDKSTF